MPLTVITGGAGFIGSHLAGALAARGERVRILDNFSTGSREEALRLADLHTRIEIVEGDVRDRSACNSACQGADFVLHHAAMASVPLSIERPAECADINITGTANILSAAKQSGSVQRVLFASSCAVYGNGGSRSIRETAEARPLSPYATTKLAGELFCRHFSELLGLETLVFRYFNVYGERQNPNGPYAAVIPRFLEAAACGGVPTVYGDGRQVRDFIYIDDIVRANLDGRTTALAAACGEPFNIASGVGTSIRDLLRELAMLTGTPIDVCRAPARPGDIRKSVADVSRAADVMSFRTAVAIRDGLQRVFTAYLQESRK
jgi:UDP-N-acetylglucosamine 4-epimerase